MTLDEFFSKKQSTSYKKGRILLRPDDAPGGVYYVVSGHVKVYSLTEWGDEKLHLIFKETEMFPIFWTFDNIALTKYYEALDNVTVRIADKQEFLQLLRKNNDILNSTMHKIIGILEISSDRIDNLEFTSAAARLVSFLFHLVQRFGIKRASKVIISAPITHRDIANSIAMTRETASREFEKLEKKGVVGYERHHIVIYSIKKLEQVLSIHYDNMRM